VECHGLSLLTPNSLPPSFLFRENDSSVGMGEVDVRVSFDFLQLLSESIFCVPLSLLPLPYSIRLGWGVWWRKWALETWKWGFGLDF